MDTATQQQQNSQYVNQFPNTPGIYQYTGMAEKTLLDYTLDNRKLIESLDKELSGFYLDSEGEWKRLSEEDRPFRITEKARGQIISMLRSVNNQVVSLGDVNEKNTDALTYYWLDSLLWYFEMNFLEGGFDKKTYDILFRKIATLIEYMLSRPRDGNEKYNFIRPTHSSVEHNIRTSDQSGNPGFFQRLFGSK